MNINDRIQAVQALVAGALAVCLVSLPGVPANARDLLDFDITSAINTAMWDDDAVSADDIDVTTREGIVTLEGMVDNILAKERAEAITEAIIGVRAIVNLIDVFPAIPRTDEDLAQAVENAWIADPAVHTWKLEAAARDGLVTLTGTAGSHAQRDLAETIAKGVRGVTGIRNEIDVDYDVVRTDAEIRKEIEARLENDVRVDDALIDTAVENGIVRLSGAVGSLQEKTQAARNAWVAGVVSVDTEELDVRWLERDEMRRTRMVVTRTDDEIADAVETALDYDPRVSPFDVDVEVSDGTVTLSGVVDNLAAKRAAEQDARNTMGVWRVRNHLNVRPEVPEDEELEEWVAAALLENPLVDRFDITVDAYRGWVYLSGHVNTSFEKNRAERIAERTRGVVGVVNNLEFDYEWEWAPDWEIRSDVRDRLQWNAFVDARYVSVSVNNGDVTLSGTVNSWTERDEAERSAYQGGARSVINELDVDFRTYGPYGPGYYGTPHYRGPGYYGPYFEPYDH